MLSDLIGPRLDTRIERRAAAIMDARNAPLQRFLVFNFLGGKHRLDAIAVSYERKDVARGKLVHQAYRRLPGLLDFCSGHRTGTVQYDCQVEWSPFQFDFVIDSGEVDFDDQFLG